MNSFTRSPRLPDASNYEADTAPILGTGGITAEFLTAIIEDCDKRLAAGFRSAGPIPEAGRWREGETPEQYQMTKAMFFRTTTSFRQYCVDCRRRYLS